MKVFVTVGTTKFDALIQEVLRLSTLEIFLSKGYSKITVQVGASQLTYSMFAELGQREQYQTERECERAFDSFMSELEEGETVQLRIPRSDTNSDTKRSDPMIDSNSDTMSVSLFRYAPSLEPFIVSSDLLVSHAGAGTCHEVLSAHVPLVVVTNDNLMDNHQAELADKLTALGHCVACSPALLCNTLQRLETSAFKKFSPGDPSLLAKFLDKKFLCEKDFQA